MRPLPSAVASPSPQSQLPSEPCSSRELSAVSPAQPRGMRTTAWFPAGAVRGLPPSLVERRWEEEEGKRGPTRPAVSSSAARGSPFAVPEAPPPGPPQPPCPPVSPPPTHVRAAPSALRPPPAQSHRLAAKPRRPIGPKTGSGSVLPLLQAPSELSAHLRSLRLRGICTGSCTERRAQAVAE